MIARSHASCLSPVDERTGLIRWVFDIPIQPGEPRVFNCSVKMADTVRYTSLPCYDNNGGSGITREAARNSAIGEGIERYCASIYDAADLIFGTARDLSLRYSVCSPDTFALFHPTQRTKFAAFTVDTPLSWVWGYSLIRQEPVLVPACLIYMPYSPCFLDRGEQGIAPAISTGLACARSREESLLKGICEVIERDAFMITWLNRLPMPRVEIASSPALHALYRDRLQRDGLNYVLVNMTTDIPVPSFLCLLIDERRSPPMVCVGGASGLNPVQAASKAMLEAVQTREWAKFLGGTDRNFSFASDFSDIRDFEDHVALHAYGNMLSSVQFLTTDNPVFTTDCWQNNASGNWSTDLEQVLHLLAEHHLEVIALDLTSLDVAECGYYVTKVLIPTLQPLHADHSERFLGGSRLYQVPRRLGVTSMDTTLDQLNPDPHPYP